jgi:hypothetical protein
MDVDNGFGSSRPFLSRSFFGGQNDDTVNISELSSLTQFRQKVQLAAMQNGACRDATGKPTSSRLTAILYQQLLSSYSAKRKFKPSVGMSCCVSQKPSSFGELCPRLRLSATPVEASKDARNPSTSFGVIAAMVAATLLELRGEETPLELSNKDNLLSFGQFVIFHIYCLDKKLAAEMNLHVSPLTLQIVGPSRQPTNVSNSGQGGHICGYIEKGGNSCVWRA